MKSLIIALSMYSRLPMPKIQWQESSMKYIFCFLPVVGVIIAVIEFLLFYLAKSIGLNSVFYAGLAAIIPILITGGIHIDGFIDTLDALYSYGSKDKAHSILEDPHVGAFAVIKVIIYFIIYFASLVQIYDMAVGYDLIIGLCTGYVISRALSVILILINKLAKKSGLLFTLSINANRPITYIVAVIWLMLSIYVLTIKGRYICMMIVIALAIFITFFQSMLYKRFKGLTGDVIGYFLSNCELIFVLIFAIGGVILV